MMKHLSAAALSLFLVGCGEEEVATCLRETEPTILLRQIAASPSRKIAMQDCLDRSLDRDSCATVNFDADTLMRSCMSSKGFGWNSEKCHITEFRDPKCYKSRWSALLEPSKPK